MPMHPHVLDRPTFDPDGAFRARRELRFGRAVYQPGDDMPSRVELGLSERDARVLFEHFMIDTYPPVYGPLRPPLDKAKAKK